MARKLAFVLASSQHGTMIVNRFDDRMVNDTHVGINLVVVHTSDGVLSGIKTTS